MTDKEKAIVMAFTGVCMLTADKFNIFHEYVEHIMHRPVYIHEMGDPAIERQIKEKAEVDFMALCLGTDPKIGHWTRNVDNSRRWDKVRFYCSECAGWQTYGKTDFCPHCGAKMDNSRKADNEDDQSDN